MLRYYALCCRNMYALKRHVRHIPKDQLTIVINTRLIDFENEAVAYCQSEGIDYAVTESNGTASQGKNSVIDLFLASDNDHFVLIDGDDYLTPHGVWTYQYIADMESPPDVLALEYQYGIWKENGYGFHYLENILGNNMALNNPYLGCSDTNNPDTVMGHGRRVFLESRKWWELGKQGKLVTIPLGDSYAKDLSDAHSRWVNLAYKYISTWETHHRIVFFSRKACDGFRYDDEYAVGEDTIMYLRYKDAHVKGDLVVKHLFDRYPTYVYDTRVNGVVEEHRDAQSPDGYYQPDYGWYLWLKKLSDKYEAMEAEGIMHENVQLPLINEEIVWPEDYVPNTLGAANYPGLQKIIYS